MRCGASSSVMLCNICDIQESIETNDKEVPSASGSLFSACQVPKLLRFASDFIVAAAQSALTILVLQRCL